MTYLLYQIRVMVEISQRRRSNNFRRVDKLDSCFDSSRAKRTFRGFSWLGRPPCMSDARDQLLNDKL